MSDAKALADALEAATPYVKERAKYALEGSVLFADSRAAQRTLKQIDEALAAYRAQAEQPKYREFDAGLEPIAKGDQFETKAGSWQAYDSSLFGRKLLCPPTSRRPITPDAR